MRRKRRKPFQGVLAKPLIRGRIAPEDLDLRVAALLRHYGVHLSPWGQCPQAAMTALVFHLAQEVVPGFRQAEKGGRPKKRITRRPRIKFSIAEWCKAHSAVETFVGYFEPRDPLPEILQALRLEAETKLPYPRVPYTSSGHPDLKPLAAIFAPMGVIHRSK
jgi:hypothetical protein